MGPWRSGVACSQVYGAATAKRREHVWVMRRQDQRKRATGTPVARRQDSGVFASDSKEVVLRWNGDVQHALQRDPRPVLVILGH
jgi:hypothetical protein